MKKLDKLYFAALKASAKAHKELDKKYGLASSFKYTDFRQGLMSRAKAGAEYQVKEDRRQAALRAAQRKAESTKCPKAFFDGYLDAALWSSNDNSDESGGEPLDRNYDVGDITQDSLRKLRKECDDFYHYAKPELDAVGASDAQNGHDFWLTRNRHGTGFWDRGYGKLGDELTKKAQSFGEADIYVSRGRLHYSG